MRRRRHRPVAVMAALVVDVTAAIGSAQAAHSSTATALPVAGGGPGATSYFDLARKDCLGTAENTASKVWYTVANGVLSDV